MDKQKEISKKVNLSKDTIESIILDPQKRMMLTSQYQTMLVDLFKAHKACEGSSDTEKEEIQKTIHNIESYLYKEREFTQLWKDLQSEKGLLSEYQTHAPHMNSIDISNEDRKEFEVIREKNLNEHRGLYLHLDHPLKQRSKRLINQMPVGDLRILLAGIEIDEDLVEQQCSRLFFDVQKNVDCQCHLTEKSIEFELMGNDDQQQTLSFDIRHFTDDQNIQLIKYLGPKGRSIPAIMNIFSASSLFNKPKSENGDK